MFAIVSAAICGCQIRKKLCLLVLVIGRVCARRKLTVDVSKMKLMILSSNDDVSVISVRLHCKKTFTKLFLISFSLDAGRYLFFYVETRY